MNLAAKLKPRAVPRKNAPGHKELHHAALLHYRALPCYVRAAKHLRAWFGNRRLRLRQWVLAP